MQRSRVAWLREGDHNTQFLHQKAMWRARKNREKSLVDDEGVTHEDHESMAPMATSYLSNFFLADSTLHADSVINLINKLVTDLDECWPMCRDYESIYC